MLPGPPESPIEMLGGRYRLLSPLGSGAMASVYRARDERGGDDVAVKVADPRVIIDPVNRRRFAIEVRSLLRLVHPHVVRVFDSGSEQGLEYYVMELCEGGSLGMWGDANGPMPARLATGMIIAASEGLHAAHELGIVHRDIKPANLLLTTDGRLKLADFGIVRDDDDLSVSQAGVGLGTLGFVAPEQRQDAKSADRRADVFALAATLHTLITNRIELDLYAWAFRPEVLEGVPAALVPVIQRAVAYAVEDRTPSAARLAEELREAIPGLPRDPPHAPLVVPVHGSHLPAAPKVMRNRRPAGAIPRSPVVLLIEEDRRTARQFRAALEGEGFKVFVAHSAAEALAHAAEYAGFFDVAILDVLLLGDQLGTQLHKLRPDLRVLYTSVLTTQSSFALGIEPAGTLLRKPCAASELLDAIQVVTQPDPPTAVIG